MRNLFINAIAVLLALLTAGLISQCKEGNTPSIIHEPDADNCAEYYKVETCGGDRHTFTIIEVDSCEYVFYVYAGHTSLAHHGNCKFCKMRE